MSVLDQSYRRWRGQPTSYFERMLVIPRYDAMEILAHKTWTAFYVLALLPPLGLAIYVYVAANLSLLAPLLPGEIAKFASHLKLPLPGPDQWGAFTYLQLWFIVTFGMLVGPPLATRDFANNALSLYLSKALRRSEYVLGRSAILLVLLSAASWVPLLVVFGLELILAPAEWRHQNAWLAGSILIATLPVVLLFTALISAVAAHVHRANLARATLLAIVLVTWPVGKMLEASTGSPAALVVSPMAMAVRVNSWAFEPAPDASRAPLAVEQPATEVSVPTALGVLALWFGACLGVLAWRVRAVEVVK